MIQTLAEGRLERWTGLPELLVSDLIDAAGQPIRSEEVTLGAYPAVRHDFAIPHGTGTLVAFHRGGRVVMLEVVPPPDIGAMSGLPEPTAVLPQEIRVEGAYAHEYFWAERGLLLTLAQRFDSARPERLVRCRGVHPLPPTVRTPGPDVYVPLDARIKW